jgi:hypothetical protein
MKLTVEISWTINVAISVILFKFFRSRSRNLVEILCGFLGLRCFRNYALINSFAGVNFYELLSNRFSVSVIH